MKYPIPEHPGPRQQSAIDQNAAYRAGYAAADRANTSAHASLLEAIEDARTEQHRHERNANNHANYAEDREEAARDAADRKQKADRWQASLDHATEQRNQHGAAAPTPKTVKQGTQPKRTSRTQRHRDDLETDAAGQCYSDADPGL